MFKHCLIWKDCMESWLKVKDLVKDCSIEIEQREISLNPQEISAKLGEFLSLDQNKINLLSKNFSTKRIQNTGGKEQELSISLSETGLPNTEMNLLKIIVVTLIVNMVIVKALPIIYNWFQLLN